MKAINPLHLTLLGILVSAAVLLHSTHAAQVFGLVAAGIDSKKITHEDPGTRLAEFHHHTDKQAASSLLKAVGDSHMYADNRSLRLLNERRRESVLPRGLHWLHQWWHMHSLSLHK